MPSGVLDLVDGKVGAVSDITHLLVLCRCRAVRASLGAVVALGYVGGRAGAEGYLPSVWRPVPSCGREPAMR